MGQDCYCQKQILSMYIYQEFTYYLEFFGNPISQLYKTYID